ncbi:MAG: hypothetical protein GY795_28640 [Desulfobacterales bacterium]|nr:hypothetical protein [Desulfobacterales bacterium]
MKDKNTNTTVIVSGRKPTAQAKPVSSEPAEDGHLKMRKLKVEKLRPQKGV